MTKVPALVNYSTKYEIVATNDRETYLVGYRLRANKRMLMDAIRFRGPELLKVLALPADASFKFTSATSVKLGDWWTIKFTGRTQKDALCMHSEYRSIGQVAAERA